MRSKRAARRLAIEVGGWTLLVLGLAALVLPGPGLLGVFAGLAILSQQYEWAERRVEPIKVAAFRSAAQGVQTWPRIIGSVLGAASLAAAGVVWGLHPDTPGWWPIADRWWLPGGWATGATLIFSSLAAFALIVFSFRRFRGVADPEDAAEDYARDDD